MVGRVGAKAGIGRMWNLNGDEKTNLSRLLTRS